MRGNFDFCLNELMKHEGLYSDHKDDPGGATMRGVTKRVYEEWVGYPVTKDFMKTLTVDHVKTLYKVKYWDKVKGDALPDGLDLSVFDFGVNAGPRRANRYLQILVGATSDGIIGPATLQAVKDKGSQIGAKALVRGYADLRHSYYRKLKHFKTFGRGWTRRVDEVQEAALLLIKE